MESHTNRLTDRSFPQQCLLRSALVLCSLKAVRMFRLFCHVKPLEFLNPQSAGLRWASVILLFFCQTCHSSAPQLENIQHCDRFLNMHYSSARWSSKTSGEHVTAAGTRFPFLFRGTIWSCSICMCCSQGKDLCLSGFYLLSSGWTAPPCGLCASSEWWQPLHPQPDCRACRTLHLHG